MKISKRTRIYKLTRPKWLWRPIGGVAYDYGPEVASRNQLPPRGHVGYIYKVLDDSTRWIWLKAPGRWVDATNMMLWTRVRPSTRPASEVVVQPMYSHIPTLPVTARMRLDNIQAEQFVKTAADHNGRYYSEALEDGSQGTTTPKIETALSFIDKMKKITPEAAKIISKLTVKPRKN